MRTGSLSVPLFCCYHFNSSFLSVIQPQFLFRLFDTEVGTVPTYRLLGTQVKLIPGSGEFDESSSSSLTLCGTITKVNPEGNSLEDQTYTISCLSRSEATKGVVLYDNVMEGTNDKDDNQFMMNVAEVKVYYNGPTGNLTQYKQHT